MDKKLLLKMLQSKKAYYLLAASLLLGLSTSRAILADEVTQTKEVEQGQPSTQQVTSSSQTETTPSSDANNAQQEESKVAAGNRFVSDADGNWYYYNSQDQKAIGWQVIDGVQLYFDQEGRQAKGKFVNFGDDSYYFDKDSGRMYANEKATIDGKEYYFDEHGRVRKNQFYYVYIPVSRYMSDFSHFIYLDNEGQKVTGWQTIRGQQLYFDERGHQIKGNIKEFDGRYYYFDLDTGEPKRNTIGQYSLGKFSGGRVFVTADGQLASGWQVVDGKKMYFRAEGRTYPTQIRKELASIDGKLYYFDDNGQLLTNQTIQYYDKTYQLDQDGVATEI